VILGDELAGCSPWFQEGFKGKPMALAKWLILVPTYLLMTPIHAKMLEKSCRWVWDFFFP